jgi:AcrR family transcriptional regulator
MPAKKAKSSAPRRRRTAEEARDEILDSAERRLREGGPDAIRLQEIAADVGISHPAVLHHFGSREGLVEAVCERAMSKLEAELLAVMTKGSETGEPPDPVAITERGAEVLGENGHARLLAWLALSGRHMGPSAEARETWKMIIDAIHAMRTMRAKSKPAIEDTRFTVALSSMALFGEAIMGGGVLEAVGLTGDDKTRKRFRAWFAKLLADRLEGG